jgi:hypothetical protein
MDSLTGNLKELLTVPRSLVLEPRDIEELFMICAARVTQLNWNKPGYTFILITDSEANWLELDAFAIDDFVEGMTFSQSLYPEYLNLFSRNESYLSVEILEESDDEEDRYVGEAIFIAEDDLLKVLENTQVISAVLESLEISEKPHSEIHKELIAFIRASLK